MARICRRLPEDKATELIGHTRRVNFLIYRYMLWLEEQLKKK